MYGSEGEIADLQLKTTVDGKNPFEKDNLDTFVFKDQKNIGTVI